MSRLNCSIVEGTRAVHRAAVVPDHQIVQAPGVAIHELALRGVLGQIADQRHRLGARPAVDGADVRGQVDASAPGSGVPADQTLRHRREIAPLLLGECRRTRARRASTAGNGRTPAARSTFFVASGNASHAARMSANSVSPPSGGITRACSMEYLAGVVLKLLSLCQSRLPRLNMRRRFSAPRMEPSISRLEMSTISRCLRR